MKRLFLEGNSRLVSKQHTYSMAFTTGGLFLAESVKVAELYLAHGDWDVVREAVLTDNLLQSRTVSSLKRISREILFRLRRLSPAELQLLVSASHQDQATILWIAICRHYRFIAEFAVEVVRERFLSLKPDLNQQTFDAFFNRKSDWYPELDSIRPSTRSKLRQVLFKMLREGGLLSTDHTIIAVTLSPVLLKLIQANPDEIGYLPALDSDARGKK